MKFSASANAECVNSPTSIDEAQAYCEKFLKLADAALHTPQIMKKAS